jgi:hypothetical protein
MSDLILEPYSVNQLWRFGRTDVLVEDSIAAYVEAIARSCSEAGECLVGHVKALALFPDGGYFRVSVADPGSSAGREGVVPEYCTGLALALTVIVYGLERPVVEDIVWDVATDLAGRWNGSVQIERK